MNPIVAVFGPGDVSHDTTLYQNAEALGAALARTGYAVLTGGYDGVMEAASKGASEAGGHVIAVTAEVYFARGIVANAFVKREVRVKSATDRLMELIDLSDAAIAIGVSAGTLVEAMTLWEFTNKKFIKPRPIITIGEDWMKIIHAIAESETANDATEIFTCVETPAQAIAKLRTHFGELPTLPSLDVLR